MSDHYIYIIFRPNGIPCYVGIGRGGRWMSHQYKKGHNKHLNNIYAANDWTLPILKISEGLTVQDAKDGEVAFIKAIGREIDGGPLVNQASGGSASSGVIHGESFRSRRRAVMLQWWSNPEHHRRMSERMQGNSFSKAHIRTEEANRKRAEKLKGNTHTLGYKPSDEIRNAVRLRFTGAKWWMTPSGERYRAAEPRSPEDVNRRKAA